MMRAALCSLMLLFGTTSLWSQQSETLTFFVTSDSHYVSAKNLERIDLNKVTIERMNAIAGQPWPQKLGGGTIGTPRGVLVLGDLIDDGDMRDQTPIQWRHFVDQFGSDGTDGILKYPVFEGWGNHDGPPVGKEKHGFSVQQKIIDRNKLRKAAGRISNVAENGLHYSWDWGNIHFVQTNLYPADKQHDKIRYSQIWHDPQAALTFLKHDLETKVGKSGRPVIVMSHCGYDTDWWHADDWAEFYQAVKPYNVIAYFFGHTGTGLKKWKPMGEEVSLEGINTGQTEKGFFVVEISPERMRLAYQVKKDATALKDVEWEWKYFLDKKISPQADGLK